MTDFASNSSQIQTKLLAKKYFELHPCVQKIIQLFAVIYAPIDKNSFISCLSKTGALDENNRPWVTKTLSSQIDKLVKSGLLVQESRLGPNVIRYSQKLQLVMLYKPDSLKSKLWQLRKSYPYGSTGKTNLGCSKA